MRYVQNIESEKVICTKSLPNHTQSFALMSCFETEDFRELYLCWRRVLYLVLIHKATETATRLS